MDNNILASENYQKTLFLEPNNIAATFNLTRIDIGDGRVEQAIDVNKAVLEQSEDSMDRILIFNELAIVSARKGQPGKALFYKKEALKEYPKIASPLGVILTTLIDISYFVKAGENDEALAILKDADNTLKEPFQDAPSLGYSIYYLELEQVEQAAFQINKLDKALKSSASSLFRFAYLNTLMKARLAELRKDYTKAIEIYKTYSHSSQTDTSVTYLLGNAYYLSGDLEVAKGYFLKHLKSSAFRPLTHLALGKLYLEQKKTLKAKEHLLIAQKIWVNAESGYRYAVENEALLRTLNK